MSDAQFEVYQDIRSRIETLAEQIDEEGNLITQDRILNMLLEDLTEHPN